ncbi:MAG TPA: hypothetical protein VGA16_00265 [Candidatus Limnocylindria bacterium]
MIRRELMRAYVAKRVGHGQRYLMTRAYLSDGTIEQRVNPGIADDEDVAWVRVGHYEDLLAERDRLRRAGWRVAATT